MSDRFFAALRGLDAQAVTLLGPNTTDPIDALLVRFPQAVLTAVDIDEGAVRWLNERYPGPRFSAQPHPLPHHHRADLVLVRHPDLQRRPDGWRITLAAACEYLTMGGHLIATTYSLTEVHLLAGMFPNLQNLKIGLEGLPPVEISGADRYILSYRRAV